MTAPLDRGDIASLIDIESLYQHAPCGFVSFLPDGTIIKINQTLLNWLKYTEEETVFQKRFSELISKGGNMHFEMFFRPMINVYGEVKELSYELISKDGIAFPVLLSATATKATDRKILAVNAALYEITDRKQFEKELVQAKKQADTERKRFTFLADLIPEIIWTADSAGRFDYFNRRFYQYFNVAKKMASPGRLLLRIHPEDRRPFVNAWHHCFKSGVEMDIKLRLENALKTFEWHIIKGAAYRDEFGTLTKWFGSCYNIDEQVKALQTRDDFINIASHELKTPVTSLKASLQVLNKLKNQPFSDMLPKLIEQANRSAERVTSLIGDLLNSSQITQGQLQVTRSRFNILKILEDCCSHIILDDNHQVVYEGDLSHEVFGDEHRISQVITNFINNALKYAPGTQRIIIKVEKVHENLKVAVIDDGPGISKEKQAQLFDRYYRVDSAGSKVQGLGLGLYISAEIIKQHKGKIGVVSTPGHGASFWFTLPLS